MPENENILRDLFEKFRGIKDGQGNVIDLTPVKAEKIWIDTAVLISDYVEKAKSVESIKQDFSSGSQSVPYGNFEKHGKRTMGAILYGKLSLDEYIQNNLKDPSPEKELLTELSGIVGGIYGDVSNSMDKLEPLLSKANKWLAEQPRMRLTKKMQTNFARVYILWPGAYK